MNERHRKWAIESLRGYARYREHGKTRAMIRHEKDPCKRWEGERIDPAIEAEIEATAARNRDLDEHDHAFVCRELQAFTKDHPHLSMLDRLLYHVYREGNALGEEDLVRSFAVTTPFEVVPVMLGEIGSSLSALTALRRFVDHLARAKEESETGDAPAESA